MSDAESKAVFLSYASQDAAVAKAICAALRDAGVEVWFDLSELRGGDAWDQKIRRQIRECALFLPVISANTQARPEGYFRLEWKLAVDRSHLMADDQAFLFPIVIGDIPDATARVPDRFRDVQWTRLRLEQTPADLAAHVARLLGAGAGNPATTPAAASVGRTGKNDSVPPRRRGQGRWWIVAPIFGMTMALVLVLRHPWQNPAPVVSTPGATKPEGAPAVPASAKLAPDRMVLARFENLTGDPKMDNIARVMENEIVHGLSAVPYVRLAPEEATSRNAIRDVARKEGAALALVGNYVTDGSNLAVSAEVVLVDDGTTLGTLGPITVPVTVRGPGWTEFIERLITGASNSVVNLGSQPKQMSAMIYNRPWPRWPVAQFVQALRERPEEKFEATITDTRALIRDNPELLKAKLDLARLLRDHDRLDESEAEFNELLDQRSQLSQSELYGVIYDRAILQGDPSAALTAARELVKIQPVGDSITKVLACLWALNQPRAAEHELEALLKDVHDQFPPDMRYQADVGLLATRIIAELGHNEDAAAGKTLDELRQLTVGRPLPVFAWLEIRVLARQGKLQPIQAALDAAGMNPSGDNSINPLVLADIAYGMLLHSGHQQEAKAILEFMTEKFATIPEATRHDKYVQAVEMELAHAQGRFDDAQHLLDLLAARPTSSPIEILGYRALLFQAQGRDREAAELDAKLAHWDLRNTRGSPLYWRARLAAQRGDKKAATDLLAQAVARGLWFGDFNRGISDYGRIEPSFAPLRGYAPYDELLRPKE